MERGLPRAVLVIQPVKKLLPTIKLKVSSSCSQKPVRFGKSNSDHFFFLQTPESLI
jgi:hypothetical protein